MLHTGRSSDQDLGNTVSGLEPTVAGALAYLLWFVSGILFFIVEKNNAFVRFHALQSIMLFGGFFVIMLIFGVIPILGFVVNFLLSICAFILWLFLMVKAAQGVAFKLPILGDLAEKNL